MDDSASSSLSDSGTLTPWARFLKWIQPASTSSAPNLLNELRALRDAFKQHTDSVTKQLQNPSPANKATDAKLEAMQAELTALRAEVADLKRAAARSLDNQPPKKKVRVDFEPNGTHGGTAPTEPKRKATSPARTRARSRMRNRVRARSSPPRKELDKPWVSGEDLTVPGMGVVDAIAQESSDFELVAEANGVSNAVGSTTEALELAKVDGEIVDGSTNDGEDEVSEEESVEFEFVMQPQTNAEAQVQEQEQEQAKPKGRKPLDSNGVQMQWDAKFALWRSVNDYSETKQPNRNPASARASIKGKPRGRTPFDSKGAPMIWDTELNLWRSASNSAEVKRTTPRPATRSLRTNTHQNSSAKFILPKPQNHHSLEM